jgi:hypothetical protein
MWQELHSGQKAGLAYFNDCHRYRITHHKVILDTGRWLILDRVANHRANNQARQGQGPKSKKNQTHLVTQNIIKHPFSCLQQYLFDDNGMDPQSCLLVIEPPIDR